jgi:predicted TIM-barrel fold metal-dependent hydrolase
VLVDAHVHLLPDRLARAIRRFFVERMPDYGGYPCDLVPARAAIAAAGVTRCWSLPYAHKPGMARDLNRWMAETFADDAMVEPGATVHPADDVAGEVAEALGELGLRVVKLHCSVGRFAPDDPRLDPLWRHVSASHRPVVVHAGHAENGQTTAAELAPLARVARRWPEARIVLAHCGAPATSAALDLLRRTPSLYADLTPVGPMLACVSREALAGVEDRLLFGSDAPNTGVAIEQSVAHVRALGLDGDAESAVLGGTAARLLAA